MPLKLAPVLRFFDALLAASEVTRAAHPFLCSDSAGGKVDVTQEEILP